MEEYLAKITSGQDADMVALLAEMTLTGGQSYSSSKPYCDGVAGDSVTSKIRPLTSQEALILTNFEANYSDAVTSASLEWWLASSGGYDSCAGLGYDDGSVFRYGFGCSTHIPEGLRPALMLNLIYE